MPTPGRAEPAAQRPDAPPPPHYCIVTGANAGLGKETAAGLMAQGCHVVLACRDMQLLDVSDKQSIRSFAEEQGASLRRAGRHLGVLVNNAGVMGSNVALPAGGSSGNTSGSGSGSGSVAPELAAADPHLVINHLGPFLLTNLLLPHMAAGSRVVNVSSRAHFACRDLGLRGGRLCAAAGPSWWFAQYARSKACNVLHASALQARGIVATSVSPGFVNTSIFRSLPPLLQWPVQRLAPLLARTPAEGAAVAVWAASSPALELPERRGSPLFLHDCKPMEPSALARDKDLAEDLWAASSAAVGWTDDRGGQPPPAA